MMDYIIVQAGGKGTRLEHLTKNKPKALVPVENLPMLFHLFRMFPEKKFIIISDYHKEVLRKYLGSFADVKYLVVDAIGSQMHRNCQNQKQNGNSNRMQTQRVAMMKAQQLGQIGHRRICGDIL